MTEKKADVAKTAEQMQADAEREVQRVYDERAKNAEADAVLRERLAAKAEAARFRAVKDDE